MSTKAANGYFSKTIMFSINLQRRTTSTTYRLPISQNWNSILKKEFSPEGVNSFAKEPMITERVNEFKMGKANKCMHGKNQRLRITIYNQMLMMNALSAETKPNKT